MTIAEVETEGKEPSRRIPTDLLILLVLIFSSSLAFGLGILVGKDMGAKSPKDEFWIEQLPQKAAPAALIKAVSEPVPEKAAEPEAKVYMASKNGTKYYLPSCSGAKRIKEENRVWFGTKEEAEAAGYSKAANCKGL